MRYFPKTTFSGLVRLLSLCFFFVSGSVWLLERKQARTFQSKLQLPLGGPANPARVVQVAHATVVPGMRSCFQPSEHWLFNSTTQLAKMKPQRKELVVLTVISTELMHTPMHLNFLFSLRKLGFQHIVALPVRALQPGELETAFWTRRELAMVQGLAQLSPEEITIVVDSTDVIFMKGPDVLRRRFLALGHDIVFGAEMLCDTLFCRHNATLKDFMVTRALQNDAATLMRFLNAGNVMGRAGSLRQLLLDAYALMSLDVQDDQAALVQLWFMTPGRLTLDYKASIFAVIPPTFEYFHQMWLVREAPVGSALVSRLTGQSPSIVHFAGVRVMAYDSGGTHKAINQCQAILAMLYDAILPMSGAPPTQTRHEFAEGMPPTRQRVVVSLTSSAGQLPYIRPVLQSLRQQTRSVEVIYLHTGWPADGWHNASRACRDGSVDCTETHSATGIGGAVRVPAFLATILADLMTEQPSPPIHVHWSKDGAPAAKLLPTLPLETDPNTLIVTVDDAVWYHPRTVADLVDAIQTWPHSAYCFAGHLIERRLADGEYQVSAADSEEFSRAPHAVDIVVALLGAIYQRDFFTDAIHHVDPTCIASEDGWISKHLAERGIPRVQLPAQHLLNASSQASVLRTRALHESQAIGPLRSSPAVGDHHIRLCASRHIQHFKRSWLEAPQPCPARMSRIFPISSMASAMSSAQRHAIQLMQSPCSRLRDQRNRTLLEQGGRIADRMSQHAASLRSPRGFVALVVESTGQLCAVDRRGIRRCWSEMSPEELQRVPAGSKLFDFGRDGNLCMYRRTDRRRQRSTNTDKVRGLFASIDADASGHVNATELNAAFATFDTDHSGGIGLSEWFHVLAAQMDDKGTESLADEPHYDQWRIEPVWCISELMWACGTPVAMSCSLAVSDDAELTIQKHGVVIWRLPLPMPGMSTRGDGKSNSQLSRFVRQASHVSQLGHGTVMLPCQSSLSSWGGTHRMVVTSNGEVCVVTDAQLGSVVLPWNALAGDANIDDSLTAQSRSSVASHMSSAPSDDARKKWSLPCLDLYSNLAPQASASHSLILQGDGQLCLYRGTMPSEHQGLVGCLGGEVQSTCGSPPGNCKLVLYDVPDHGSVALHWRLNRTGELVKPQTFLMREVSIEHVLCPRRDPLTDVGSYMETGNAFSLGQRLRSIWRKSGQHEVEYAVSVSAWGQLCLSSTAEDASRCLPSQAVFDTSTTWPPPSQELWAEMDTDGHLTMYDHDAKRVPRRRILWRALLTACRRLPCAISPGPNGLVVTDVSGNGTLSLERCLGWTAAPGSGVIEGRPYGRRIEVTQAHIECGADALAQNKPWSPLR